MKEFLTNMLVTYISLTGCGESWAARNGGWGYVNSKLAIMQGKQLYNSLHPNFWQPSGRKGKIQSGCCL